jgi:hypothetical protein
MRGASAKEPVRRIRYFGSENVRYTAVLKASGTSTSTNSVSQNEMEQTNESGREVVTCLEAAFIITFLIAPSMEGHTRRQFIPGLPGTDALGRNIARKS